MNVYFQTFANDSLFSIKEWDILFLVKYLNEANEAT